MLGVDIYVPSSVHSTSFAAADVDSAAADVVNGFVRGFAGDHLKTDGTDGIA